MEYLNNCPVCQHSGASTYLEAHDHFLSREKFTVTACSHCGFRFLNPRPSASELPAYYQSTEYISHSNARKSLQDRIYQSARKIALSRKYKIIASRREKGHILDAGCGTGEFLMHCRSKGWTARGIEPNEGARNQAISNHGLEVKGEEYFGQLEAASFDVITLWHVLEHIPELELRLTQLCNALKPNGILLIALPNSDSRDALRYGPYWAAWDLPRHLYHFTPSTLKRLMTNFPVHYQETLPMKMDAYYISLLSEKYKSGKPSWIKALLSGFRSNFSARHSGNYSSLIYLFQKAGD